MADDDVMFSFPPDVQAELEQLAQERGAPAAALIGEAVDAWDLAHADPDGTPGLEARARREGRLSPKRMAKLIQEAMA